MTKAAAVEVVVVAALVVPVQDFADTRSANLWYGDNLTAILPVPVPPFLQDSDTSITSVLTHVVVGVVVYGL